MIEWGTAALVAVVTVALFVLILHIKRRGDRGGER